MLTKSKFARRSIISLAAVSAIFIALPTVTASAASMTKLTVVAKGMNEKAGAGAMSGSVKGSFTTDVAKNTLCYSITNKGIKGISGIHIHVGAAGVDGDVAVALDPMKIGKKSSTCVKVAAKVLADIAANPSMYYFNAHNATYPNGAVRGQLSSAMMAK